MIKLVAQKRCIDARQVAKLSKYSLAEFKLRGETSNGRGKSSAVIEMENIKL